jgi:acetylornithine deacetylase/succinyl-diaminopimelate desuccinylase-like protein
MRPNRLAVLPAVALAGLVGSSLAAQMPPPEAQKEGRAILREMVDTDTSQSTGDTTVLAKKLAARLVAAGLPAADVEILGDAAKRGNLVARLRGTNARTPAVLFLAHLDVVDARRADWTMDPYRLTEQDGWLYGRGTLDVKGGGATLVSAFARLAREGFRPDRDLILALTADEEGGEDNGVDWLLQHRPEKIAAAYVINLDAGGAEIGPDRPVAFDVQASEKVFGSFTVTARNRGGHSSLPVPDNAIYRLAAGLVRLGQFTFPTKMNEITRAYFARKAESGTGSEAADFLAVSKTPPDEDAVARLSKSSPFYNAQFRTTCVATLLEGGHAENALPQTAKATVNCRMLPGEDPKEVEATLRRVIDDPELEVAPLREVRPSPPSPLSPEVFGALEKVLAGLWGKVPIVPRMDTGASDGLYFRRAGIPVYGLNGIAYDFNDDRSHGKDERILARAFDEGVEFHYRLARALGGGEAVVPEGSCSLHVDARSLPDLGGLPQATITLLSGDGKLVRKLEADGSGQADVRGLSNGRYFVRAEIEGFVPSEVGPVEVCGDSNCTAHVMLGLNVGSACGIIVIAD